MRLLQLREDGRISLAGAPAVDDTIPPYAILSHTWGPDNEEVTFEDITNGSGEDKAGYEKIRFCAEQARQDGLQYFWIDTCCIDKTNKAELSRSINFMFRWYRNSARCYVYLSDVSTLKRKRDENLRDISESGFQRSRWFTRGWTLQELLAPASVEFFSRDRRRLGDKQSLEQEIHAVTNIPQAALRGSSLSQFSVYERMSWIEHRETKLEEDKAYSLLGIFGVRISPLYGEGAASAFKRLHDEIEKLEKCIRDLRLTDPRDDKKRIEDTKGGLLEDSYHWILENPDFQQWCNNEQSRLLWIKGDPGKGKTMLLCGITNELKKSIAKSDLLSYFFCQATDSRINSAKAVLRSLIYLLIDQEPSLMPHVQRKYEQAGKMLFEDANAWLSLCEILTNILQDPSVNYTYLVVDALDECVTDLPKLLHFIVRTSSLVLRVKWIVSSRNWPSIEKELDTATQEVRLCLELNEESVSAAVAKFIQSKVIWLSQRNKYNSNTRNAVQRYVSLNANGTFLWVALVCQELSNTPGWKTMRKLTAFPPGLDALYQRMINQIRKSDDAELCTRILATVSAVHRPLTLDELASVVELPEGVAGEDEPLSEIIGLCGSMLTMRGRTISFVHQSAKDFLVAKTYNETFPSGIEYVHQTIFARSLLAMSEILRRDMYGLGAPGFPTDQVKQPDPDPLSPIRYSCVYWVDHLLDCAPNRNAPDDFKDGGSVDGFLRQKYLYWLEALSLCRSMSEGVLSIGKLKAFLQRKAEASRLLKLVHDAHRFIMSHKLAIETSPLQAYKSALLFSPTNSLIRSLFNHEESKWITILPAVPSEWSACLQTLEGHREFVYSVAFSPDSTQLASASGDRTVKIWDIGSGACLHTLESHSDDVNSVAFSPNSTQLASASDDKTIKIWDISCGARLQTTLEGHSDIVLSIAFSPDSTQLASASKDKTVKIWNIGNSAAYLQTLEGHRAGVISVAFSSNSTQLASASHDKTVKIWDIGSSGTCLWTLEGHRGSIRSVAFSPDSTWLASASDDMTVKIWDVGSSGTCLWTLEGHSDYIRSVAFSPASTQLASASDDRTVKIWDVGSSSTCLQTLGGHSGIVRSVVFSPNSTQLASASNDKTVKIWDTGSSACPQTLDGHSGAVWSVAISPDSTRLASSSSDKTVKIWNTASSACLQTLEGHGSAVWSVAFSPNSAWLASASGDKTIKIWDIGSGACLQTLEGHSEAVWSVVFSPDSTLLASLSDDKNVKIWDVDSRACLQTLEPCSYSVASVTFSPDSTQLAWASYNLTIEIWDIDSGACLQTLQGHSSAVKSVAFSPDSTRLASASRDKTVKLWDRGSGTCLQTIEVGAALNNISFDATGLYLHTQLGIITFDTSIIPSTASTETKSEAAQYKSIGLSGYASVCSVITRSQNATHANNSIRFRNSTKKKFQAYIGHEKSPPNDALNDINDASMSYAEAAHRSAKGGFMPVTTPEAATYILIRPVGTNRLVNFATFITVTPPTAVRNQQEWRNLIRRISSVKFVLNSNPPV